MHIETAPRWVKKPLLLTEHQERKYDDGGHASAAAKCNYLHAMQSPYAETPTTNPNIPQAFAGMYYYKILTPAQAYEWIVFDCFK